uniref:Uncharacterized protein n=2 Tax=Pectinophora gossypiella TaxID=13191 RepID=A0A1E1W2D2_PECGO
MLKTENVDLVKRVKSYFDSHFSSGTTSQHSISDCTTQQNSKTSDEFDIISFVTQVNSNRASSQSEQDAISKNPSPISSQSAEINDKPKKIRYKKNGLSFRLNTILKKQNANVSLWQHEKFLAESSNFVIPKGEHLVFQIQKAEFKYGCYLLEVVDVNNLHFLILINSCYVQNVNITQNMILKLYDPYKIVEFKEDCKLIINTCKFECISLRQ